MRAFLSSLSIMLLLVSCAVAADGDDGAGNEDDGEVEDVGPADVGEACVLSSDCASNRCHFETCWNDECAAGCAADEVCANDKRGHRLCEAPGIRGEKCRRVSDLGGEGFEKPCASDLVCADLRPSLGDESFCVPPVDRDAGERCLNDDECSTGHCSELYTSCAVGVGEPCTRDEECDERCGPAGTCVHDECPAVIRPCDGGGFCQGGPCGRVCAPLKQSGEVCLVDDVCADVFGCDQGLVCGTDGVCVSA